MPTTISQINKTYASLVNGQITVDPSGDCPAIHVIFSSGEEELQMCTSIVIDMRTRSATNVIETFYKLSTDEKFYSIPNKNSQIYKNNKIMIDDFWYCPESGEGAGIGVPESQAFTTNEDGSKTLNEGYCTLYEYYKQHLAKPYILDPLREVMHARNANRTE